MPPAPVRCAGPLPRECLLPLDAERFTQLSTSFRIISVLVRPSATGTSFFLCDLHDNALTSLGLLPSDFTLCDDCLVHSQTACARQGTIRSVQVAHLAMPSLALSASISFIQQRMCWRGASLLTLTI